MGTRLSHSSSGLKRADGVVEPTDGEKHDEANTIDEASKPETKQLQQQDIRVDDVWSFAVFN